MAVMLTRPEAARLLDVKPPALDRALVSGRIHYADREHRLFDKACLVACWGENRQRRRKPVPAGVAPAAPAAGESEAELRRRKLAAETTAAEMALAEKRGRLIDADAAGREFTAFIVAMVSELDQFGVRIAPKLVGLDVRAMARAIDDEQRLTRWRVLIAYHPRTPPETMAEARRALGMAEPAPGEKGQ